MTRPAFRRLDPPDDNALSPTLDESRLLPVLTHMAAELLAARARGENPSQRAPTVADLTAAALTAADCLDLISDGHLAPLPARSGEHRRASRSASSSKNGRSNGRSKSPSSKKPSLVAATPLHLGPDTRLILTDAGLALMTKHAQSSRVIEPSPSGTGQGEGGSPSARSSKSASSPLLPRYDIDLRELSVAGGVILRLPVHGRNLIAVLTELQHSGWKPRVIKPLNGRSDGAEPQHLADAVYSLNQRQSLIEFHADDGAIRWEWRSLAKSARRDVQVRNGKAVSRRGQHAPDGREHRQNGD